jgi:2-polyprenyl-6-methoxyphenol hydroxylase-like FAD-dependent oxidoreductase
MFQTLQIAIVGGGPGGLTAAVILHKQGHHVRVYETDLSADHRKQGGTLDLHANTGQIALRHAGLLDEFRAIARHEDQQNKNMDPVTGLVDEAPPHSGEDMDRPEIDRGVLRDVLLAALPDECVVWNSHLDRVELGLCDTHCLIFHNGSRVDADIVIGADGAWSRVRKALTPALPFYTGITFLEGWIEKPTAVLSDLVGRGSMFSFGGPEAIFAQRNGAGRICVYAAVKRSQAWLQEHLGHTTPRSRIMQIYEGWCPNLLDLLGGCETFIERPIYSLPVDFSWPARSGITLIGDAAHLMPPLGVGVNLAMQDAADLAIAVGGASDWHEALLKTEIEIRERAHSHMREIIPGFAEWFSEPSPFCNPT